MSDTLLTDLRARLVAAGITGTQLGRLEDQPDAATALSDYGAGPSRDVMTNGLPVLETRAVQVLTRGTAAGGLAACETTAWAAYRALVGRHVRLPNPTTGPRAYDWIAAVQAPYHLGFDTLDRPLIVFNVEIQRWVVT